MNEELGIAFVVAPLDRAGPGGYHIGALPFHRIFECCRIIDLLVRT